jgi:putative endonuclease
MAGLVPAIHVLQSRLMSGGFVYIVTNKPNGILYIGVTSDLIRRIHEHREGSVKGFTKRYNLKRLVWFEQHEDVRTAIQREKSMKHWPRAWKVRTINAQNQSWNDLFDDLL